MQDVPGKGLRRHHPKLHNNLAHVSGKKELTILSGTSCLESKKKHVLNIWPFGIRDMGLVNSMTQTLKQGTHICPKTAPPVWFMSQCQGHCQDDIQHPKIWCYLTRRWVNPWVNQPRSIFGTVKMWPNIAPPRSRSTKMCQPPLSVLHPLSNIGDFSKLRKIWRKWEKNMFVHSVLD